MLILLLSGILLSNKPPPATTPARETVAFSSYFEALRESFSKRENAALAMAFLTGKKQGLTPKTKSDFKKLELSFLLSPGGRHFGFIFLLLLLPLRWIKKGKLKKILRLSFYGVSYYVVPFLALKRLLLFRLLMILFRRKVSAEILFFITFLLAFLLGHFSQSALGYAYSFLYMGTFLAFRNEVKLKILAGLLCSHLLAHIFTGAPYYFLSVVVNLPLLFLFGFLIPLVWTYAMSFHFTSNWIEPLLRGFILLIHSSAKLLSGSVIDPSFFLVAALILILFRKKNKVGILICLLLHGNFANSPVCFYSGSYSQVQRQSEGR